MSNIILLTPKNARPAARKLCFEAELAQLTSANEELAGAIKALFAHLNILDCVLEIVADSSEKERLAKQSIANRKMLAQAMHQLALDLTRMKGSMRTGSMTGMLQ